MEVELSYERLMWWAADLQRAPCQRLKQMLNQTGSPGKKRDYEEILETKTSTVLLIFKLLLHQHFQEFSFRWLKKILEIYVVCFHRKSKCIQARPMTYRAAPTATVPLRTVPAVCGPLFHGCGCFMLLTAANSKSVLISTTANVDPTSPAWSSWFQFAS